MTVWDYMLFYKTDLTVLMIKSLSCLHPHQISHNHIQSLFCNQVKPPPPQQFEIITIRLIN